MNSILQKILFSMPEEISHSFSLESLKVAKNLKLLNLFTPNKVEDEFKIAGIKFGNRMGLAAGLDKNGDYIDALASLGFGFIEVGTITPRAQDGNPQPRLFRHVEQQAIINRMGFNNKGADYVVKQLKKRQTKIPVGVNIGKNKTTSLENAVEDYKICLEKIYPYADYISVNISSPNTPDLRQLQSPEYLQNLINQLQEMQKELQNRLGVYRPIFIKIAPDFEDLAELDKMLEIFNKQKIDGVIATNTSIDKSLLRKVPAEQMQGGVSGKPIVELSNKILQIVGQKLDKDIPIIGVGGVASGKDAQDKIRLGASLVQIYTAFIYQGVQIIPEVAEAILAMGKIDSTDEQDNN